MRCIDIESATRRHGTRRLSDTERVFLRSNACSPYRPPVQRTFDDLGTPLSQVTFCVVDLETTGGSVERCAITEVGAIKVRGGECLGTFQSLVNPGMPIPPEITVLTGITQAMVIPAPRIEPVLAAFDEFSSGTVIVGHNVRFDLSFLAAARRASGWAPMTNPWVDTCALARRLVRDEVPNCRLSTLARSFRLSHQPSHRALDDALATADLLHFLLERAAAYGVLGLDDLLALPRINAHPQAAKLRLTDRLPRLPGVYLFRDAGGRPLYVGKATNLRQRVRSYFSSDDRRKIGQLLRETQQIDHIPCTGPLDAAVLELRLIHRLQPRFNRQGKQWGKYSYVKLTLNERFPRLAVARTGAGRRRSLRRSVAIGSRGAASDRSDRDGDAVAPVHRFAGSVRSARSVRARPARSRDVPVLGSHLRGRLPSDRRSHRQGDHDRPRGVARSAASPDDRARGCGTIRGSRRRARSC